MTVDQLGGYLKQHWPAIREQLPRAVRTACVEPQHPIPNDLRPDAADLRRLRARRTVINRRKSQKPSSLRPILRLPRQATQLHRKRDLGRPQKVPTVIRGGTWLKERLWYHDTARAGAG